MTVSLIVDNTAVPVKVIKFSDGSSNIKLEVPQSLKDSPPENYFSISVDTKTPADNYLWEILLLAEAVYQTFGYVLPRRILHIPYLPHARADRVFEYGNSHPLEAFLSAIVNKGFTSIYLTDPHSDYYIRILNVEVKPQHECFLNTVRTVKSGDVLVAPDKGALAKIYKLQQALDKNTIATFVVEAGKKRDKSTGKIIDTTIPEDFNYKGKTFYITDDLLDAGGTFIPLAQKLKEAGAKEVNLYVTHMIAAKGLDLFKGIIDNIYCYQIIGEYITMKDVQEFNNQTIKLGDCL